jgi:dipeptidyl aminopeptidase/acylaminoacyl peptidase
VEAVGPRRRWKKASRLSPVALAALVTLPLLVSSLPVTAQADHRRPMTLIDLAELPRVLDPQLSPDGRMLTFMRSHADWKAGRAIWNLWRQPIGGTPEQLSFAESGEVPGATRWSPDGTSVIFWRDSQLHLMPRDGGEARPLTHHQPIVYPGIAPAWSPDGAVVYFTAPEPRTPDELERDRARDDVYGLDETTFKQRHLWKIAVATGVETRITSGDWSVLGFRLSRDGRQIVFHRGPSPLTADAPGGEIWMMDADGAHARAVTHNNIEETGAELSPDHTQILFLSESNARFEPYYNSNLFLASTAGSTIRAAIPDFAFAVDQATWAPDGRSIYAVVNMGVHSEIFQIDWQSGRYTQLTDGKHFIPPGWNLVASAGRMVFQLDEPERFGDIYTLAIGSKVAPTRVTNAYDVLERDFILPRQEKVDWVGSDGTRIEGLIFYPIGFDASKRYPLVVQMHGGPMESDKFGAGAGLLMNYFPVLAARGYLVLRPNYRGSTGYGNAFLRAIIGHYFDHMTSDILAGVDALVARGVADPDRVVLMGWSAGGHLANKLISMTPRFRAASSGASVANWTSLYAQTDTRATRTVWFGGTPWQKDAPITLYWEQSPLKDVARITTPTLLLAGENDARVPKEQAIEMYRALRSNGVPTRLWIAPREPHQWGELRHLLFKANIELEWFEKYAMGRTYAWEKAP